MITNIDEKHHLTATNKRHIEAMFAAGETDAKVNRIEYHIRPNPNTRTAYTVMIVTREANDCGRIVDRFSTVEFDHTDKQTATQPAAYPMIQGEGAPHMKATKNTTKSGWSFATLHGVGQCLVYMRKGEMKYYRLANITNGYTTIFNFLWDKFQVSHPEIGACIAEFKNLSEAVDYAGKG